jgi:hypothetical protein
MMPTFGGYFKKLNINSKEIKNEEKRYFFTLVSTAGSDCAGKWKNEWTDSD